MIQLTRLNHVPFFLNSSLIEHVERTPDTVVTLTNGQKFLVEETPEEVARLFREAQRNVYLKPNPFVDSAADRRE